jgi:hypothetical protein
MKKWTLLALMSLMVACGDKDDDDGGEDEDDTSSGSDTDSGGSTGGGSGSGGDGSTAGPEPVILEADAWCYTPGGSVEGDFWGLKAIVEDPQGPDTMPGLQAEAVRVDSSGGGTLMTMAMVCDSLGTCTGSDSVANLGFGCGSADAQTFVFTISDEDGNVSEAVSVVGRQGSTAEGR